MSSRTGLILGLLLLLGAGPAAAQDEKTRRSPPSKPLIKIPTAKPKPPQYRWEPLDGGDRMVLFLDERKLGVFDQKNKVYRSYLPNGKLSEPTNPPWEKDRKEAQPPPPKPTPEAAPTTAWEKTSPPEEDDPARPVPWLGFAAGGFLAVVVVAVAVMARKH